LSRAIAKVTPSLIRWKLSVDFYKDRVNHDLWRTLPRHAVTETEKNRSIVMHFRDGVPWEETPLFDIYRRRLAQGDTVRGGSTLPEVVADYKTRVTALFHDMRQHGWQRSVNGKETRPIPVYIAHDGEILMSNQGNHRLAMAQILKLDHVLVEIVGRHPDAPEAPGPKLPESAQAIPAMTTDAERLCYYRHTLDCASRGAVVELGAWLGASTAYIAAGIRDAGAKTKAQVYDRFVWKPEAHNKKAGGPLGMSQLDAFRQNLGPLLEYVDVHPGELNSLRWNGGDISLLVCDAPKRIAEISTALTTFTGSMPVGSLMAWQDFAYFPSYDIPAALMRLSRHVAFVEAVYPGTTAVFRVEQPWTAKDVSPSALALEQWTADEVEAAWSDWDARLPEPMRPRFACGAAMFLCDLGAVDRARRHLAAVVTAHPGEVLPKWRYLITERARLMERYRPLVEVVKACA
jgi:hypothetical protein